MAGKTLAMIFEKPSLRTRVSFDVGMNQLGGHSIMLTAAEIQLKSDTSVPDAARALSRYCDLIMFRTFAHAYLTSLAENSTIPVINGLTNDTHPCQVLADIMAFEEHRGPLDGKIIAWSGDGRDNVCTSWIHAAKHFPFTLRIAAPKGHQPDEGLLAAMQSHGAQIEITDDPAAAARDADCILTDTWVSMGQEADTIARREMFVPYQVNSALMALAKKDAVFMHCLPAYRGQEVTRDVIDGPQSIVWDEAENRLHAQKAVMLWCMGVI
jgi:ornithine carbamoyltransferase